MEERGGSLMREFDGSPDEELCLMEGPWRELHDELDEQLD